MYTHPHGDNFKYAHNGYLDLLLNINLVSIKVIKYNILVTLMIPAGTTQMRVIAIISAKYFYDFYSGAGVLNVGERSRPILDL